jgi:FtsP/CotA-like multicopper oxidase with cupredoxin domain
MSKAGRLGLLALALVVAVLAFVVLKPGDDDEKVDGTPAAQTAKSPTATSPSAQEPPTDGPDAVPSRTITLTKHAANGGAPEIKAAKGQTVRFVVTSDAPDEIHVHGYDIEREVAPGEPARFSFKADIEGIFEIESHEAEHAGEDALIAKLVVEPS